MLNILFSIVVIANFELKRDEALSTYGHFSTTKAYKKIKGFYPKPDNVGKGYPNIISPILQIFVTLGQLDRWKSNIFKEIQSERESF